METGNDQWVINLQWVDYPWPLPADLNRRWWPPFKAPPLPSSPMKRPPPVADRGCKPLALSHRPNAVVRSVDCGHQFCVRTKFFI